MAMQNGFCLEEEELSCPICFEDFNLSEKNRQPKLLLCLHTFCLACMETLRKFNGSLQCSICRTSHHVYRVEELMDNYVICNYLRFKQECEDEKLATQYKNEYEASVKILREQEERDAQFAQMEQERQIEEENRRLKLEKAQKEEEERRKKEEEERRKKEEEEKMKREEERMRELEEENRKIEEENRKREAERLKELEEQNRIFICEDEVIHAGVNLWSEEGTLIGWRDDRLPLTGAVDMLRSTESTETSDNEEVEEEESFHDLDDEDTEGTEDSEDTEDTEDEDTEDSEDEESRTSVIVVEDEGSRTSMIVLDDESEDEDCVLVMSEEEDDADGYERERECSRGSSHSGGQPAFLDLQSNSPQFDLSSEEFSGVSQPQSCSQKDGLDKLLPKVQCEEREDGSIIILGSDQAFCTSNGLDESLVANYHDCKDGPDSNLSKFQATFSNCSESEGIESSSEDEQQSLRCSQNAQNSRHTPAKHSLEDTLNCKFQ